MKVVTIPTLLSLLLIGSGCLQAADDILAETVWLPEVDTMYQTDIETPSWVHDVASESIVVRGVNNGGTQSARAIAIREIVIPRLYEGQLDPPGWTPWRRYIAEREIGRWLNDSGPVIKKFRQPYFKVIDGDRYEAFTREAWLLRISDDSISRLKHQISHSIHVAQHRYRHTLAIAVGGVLALFFLCWYVFAVLDRVTHGYYIGWLRLALTMVFLIAAGLAVHFTQLILQRI